MRYRGREDICYNTTDEARLGSDEFLQKGVLVGFFGVLYLQRNWQTAPYRLGKIFWFSKEIVADIIWNTKHLHMQLTCTYVFLGSFAGCSVLQ